MTVDIEDVPVSTIDRAAEIARLQERRHRLVNCYGDASYEEAWLTNEIAMIDERLAALGVTREVAAS